MFSRELLPEHDEHSSVNTFYPVFRGGRVRDAVEEKAKPQSETRSVRVFMQAYFYFVNKNSKFILKKKKKKI